MSTSRRRFLQQGAAAAATPLVLRAAPRRPNVIVIITDDHGYGDLSLHGNPHLKTPNLDSIGTSGVQFTQFQVTPVCSPTRAGLMTGRYNYRTGVVDTFRGRSMMHPDETTVAELLSGAGYRTGIFGKWHLGDNYPMRAIDQGFQEALTLKGGGLAQPSGPPGNGYFDPVLQYNGKEEKRAGYCTDIFFNAAADFVAANRARPFFAYVGLNAPHDPLQIDESYVAPFRTTGLDEQTAKVYGMVRNIDENAGRLLARLRELRIERDTIMVFLTDNGPQRARYNAGMRGTKGTPYQGGIRVPFFVSWPGTLKAGAKVDRAAANIDLLPTVLDACGVSLPKGLRIDGRSLMPLLRGGAANWPDRMLFSQWHRGDEPQPFNNCAARNQRWKLVNGRELYDLESDPGEQHDVAAQQPDVAARLRKGYEDWFRDVSSTRGYAPPRIYLGTEHENPVTLTRQDWRGEGGNNWNAPEAFGHWEVDVRSEGRYDVTVQTYPIPAAGTARFQSQEQPAAAGATEHTFKGVALPRGPARLEPFVAVGGKRYGARYVHVKKV